jgi:hypothetical protein
VGSSNKSDGKDVKFLDRPQVLTAGVLVSLVIVVVIVVVIVSDVESFWNFINHVLF